MKTYDKYLNEDDDFFYDESSQKGVSLRKDTELFCEDDDVVAPMIRVTREKNGWKIINADKEVSKIPDSMLTSKEASFLRSPSGAIFLIGYVKNGYWKSVSDLKRKLKEMI
jgi:hypothetical protein